MTHRRGPKGRGKGKGKGKARANDDKPPVSPITCSEDGRPSQAQYPPPPEVEPTSATQRVGARSDLLSWIPESVARRSTPSHSPPDQNEYPPPVSPTCSEDNRTFQAQYPPQSEPTYGPLRIDGPWDWLTWLPEGAPRPTIPTRSPPVPHNNDTPPASPTFTEDIESLSLLDNEPSPRTQVTANLLDNANSWIPEGVAGPSVITHPPTPEREPHRFSDVGAEACSRQDSATDEADTSTQRAILHSIQSIIAGRPIDQNVLYGGPTVQPYPVLPSPSSERQSSDGLMMAPYDVLRRRFASRSPSTRGSPQGRSMLVRASLTPSMRPAPNIARRRNLEVERQAMDRLRTYAGLDDVTAQQLLRGFERRLFDWQNGNIRELHGVFLSSSRHDSTQLPPGYLPRFARRSVEIVEHARAEEDLWLLAVEDNREFVLAGSRHAPLIQPDPDTTHEFRSASVPPTSRGREGVEVQRRTRSWSPPPTYLEDESDEEPAPTESPSPTLAAAFMSTQGMRQPVAQPAGQQFEGMLAGWSGTRDSVVRTSVDDTTQKRDGEEDIDEEEAAV